MQLKFVKDDSNYRAPYYLVNDSNSDIMPHYLVKRILNHAEELTTGESIGELIGELKLDNLKDKWVLTYYHWNNFSVYSQLPLDEREQIADFMLSNSSDQITLEFID